MVKNISRIEINATPGKVWEVLTKPELVKLWQYGSELITDWQPGADIRFRTEWEGKVFEQWGKILEINHPSLIRYSLFAPAPGREDKPENYFIMNYNLSQTNGQTILQMVQEDNRPGAIEEKLQDEENPILQTLKKLAEI